MQRLEVSGAVRPIYGSLGVKQLKTTCYATLVRFQLRLVDEAVGHPWHDACALWLFEETKNLESYHRRLCVRPTRRAF